MAHVARSWNEYQISMSVLGENTLENAKKLGYLDARELYPDITPLSFEEYATQFYSMQDPGSVFHRQKWRRKEERLVNNSVLYHFMSPEP